jgi:hypothetical protein
MNNEPKTEYRMLSVFSLVMITVGSVDSIRNLPATALFGSSLLFFFVAAAILFLLPSSLARAWRYLCMGKICFWQTLGFSGNLVSMD